MESGKVKDLKVVEVFSIQTRISTKENGNKIRLGATAQ